jgi:hypothetical protein
MGSICKFAKVKNGYHSGRCRWNCSKEFFEQANSKAITVENQMAFIQYSTTIITLYDELVLANTDYIAAKDLVDVLLELDDPRLPSYFGVNNVGEICWWSSGRASNYPGCLNQAHVSLHLML